LSVKKNAIKNKTAKYWLQDTADIHMHESFLQRYPDTYAAPYTDEHDVNILDNMYSYPYDFYEKYKVLQDRYFNNDAIFQQEARFWGIKKLPGNTSPFLPRGYGSNLFAGNKGQPKIKPYVKLFVWYNLYKDYQQNNPVILGTNIFNSYEISGVQANSRLTIHSVLKEKLPITKLNGYEAILCDFKGVHPQFPIDVFGEDNIDILDVGSYLGKHIDFVNRPTHKKCTLKRVTDDRSWWSVWQSRYEEVFNFLEGHYHQINVYQKGKLVFSIPAGKVPLRVNIDYFDYRSFQGFCQFCLWFFFNVREWQDDKQYFSVEV